MTSVATLVCHWTPRKRTILYTSPARICFRDLKMALFSAGQRHWTSLEIIITMRKTNQIRINKKGRIQTSTRTQTSKATGTRRTHITSNLHGLKSGRSEMATNSSSILALTTWPLSIELTHLWMLILGIAAIINPRRAVQYFDALRDGQ